MNAARLGIVRLPLPDGREVALQLTFARLDAVGHVGIMEKMNLVAQARSGSATARAELLEVFSDGQVTADEVAATPPADYPAIPVQVALFRAWEIAQYGPDGRPAVDGAANPPQRRPTWWATAFGRLFGRG